jgi:putative transposase
LIRAEWRDDLHAYLGGIVRELNGTAKACGGTADHVHLLVSLPQTLTVAELLRVMKANSARWVKREKGARGFGWQTGYAVYSVSESNAAAVAKYIAKQQEHHRRNTFQEEYLTFLKKNRIEYDARFIWG